MPNFVNPHIRRYKEYIPGEQSSSKIIKLNANENLLPPHPKIGQYLKNFSAERLRYYPDPQCRNLEKSVRKSYGLKENVGLVFGNGADEIIRGIFKTFFTPHQDSVLLTQLTYPAYSTYADLEGIALEYLPVNPDFTVSFKGLGKSRSRVFFLTNPNSPTGILVEPDTIFNMVKAYPDKLFIVDEAYAPFVNAATEVSCLRYLPQPNLIVLQTASKAFSACGLRLGFSASTTHHAQCIRKVLDPYHLSLLTQEIGSIVLSDLDFMKTNVKKTIQIREWFKKQLEKMNFQIYPSQTNFLLVRPPSKVPKPNTAKLLFEFLKKEGIFVRYFDKKLLSDCLRITIGRKKDMLQVLMAIEKFYSKGNV